MKKKEKGKPEIINSRREANDYNVVVSAEIKIRKTGE